jgi:hypothetical protein
MARWIKGQSGNPQGRPREGTAIAGLARSQVERHKLIEKLGGIGAREGEYAKVDVDQQIRAIQLLLAYGYGPPRAELEGGDAVVIEVTYVERNQIRIDGTAPSAIAGGAAGETVQRGLLRSPLGEDGIGNGSADPLGATG